MGLQYMNLRMYLLLSCLIVSCYSNDDEQMEKDLYRVDTTHDRLAPFDWHYKRVELPPLMTFASLQVEPRADFGKSKIKIAHVNNLPVLCLRKGGPPLPDISNLDKFPNGSKNTQNLWSAGQCYVLRERVMVEFTSEQISPDVFFVGLFNGIGPIRTQAKMINRGPIYDFSTIINAKSCKNQSMRGQLCNQRVEELSCPRSPLYKFGRRDETNEYNGTSKRSLACSKFLKQLCHQDLASKTYFLNVLQPAEELKTSVFDLRSLKEQYTEEVGITLMCYARYGEIPGNVSYDYAVNLTRTPLVISRPKIGTWYFNIQPVDKLNVQRRWLRNSNVLCHSVVWDVHECPDGKAGPNCTSQRYMLQVAQRGSSDAFLAYFPKNVSIPVELHNLPLEPLLSNTSFGVGKESDFAWTYFDFKVQQGAYGNIHIELTANTTLNYQLYIRFGGLPSVSEWDYFYINQRSNSDNGSSMFKLYEISERRVNAYLLYPEEGLWSFGFRHSVLSNPHWRTEVSLSVENCPNQCSDHGKCSFHSKKGPTDLGYYFCKCDGRYGGFDCGTELVSPSAQRWHVVLLVASNAAALLPAVLALHQKAYAEWVVFICSGVASALYHACDIGSWCALHFNVLQFMDFWLAFMAVLSTIVYLAFISEDARRTMHTISTIVTVLIAVNGPTKSKNIPIVLALGAFALIFAWLMELFSTYRSNSPSSLLRSGWNIQQIWLKVKLWFPNLLKTLNKRFQWRFFFPGCIAFSMAALSWNLESVESYWIWHSVWHVSIYASAFFFLCSRVNINHSES